MAIYTADPAGTVRIEVRKGKREKLLGTFGVTGNNGAMFVPGEQIEISDERLDEVARTLALYGDPPYVYRQSPHPLMPDPAADDAQPDEPGDGQADVGGPSDGSAVPPGDAKPARRRQRDR